MIDRITELLGNDSDKLLKHTCTLIPKENLYLPGPDFVARVLSESDRSPAVLRNLQLLFNSGALAGTGYLSILPVDQGIEHSAGASFSANPMYFDPKNIVSLAYEAGCNAVASSVGVLGAVARSWAHRIPFIAKINHNELLSYPNTYDQRFFGSVRQAFDMGAVGLGATIYFGSPESRRQIEEISCAFEEAHRLGLFTVLWCYLRNKAFVTATADFHTAADLTGQANHLGVSIQADLIKQKQPKTNGGYAALNFGATSANVYKKLTNGHPVDLTRYQVANCYMGRAGLINSGGPSGTDDLREAVAAAVINKRAGGMGLITGRKAFQKPFKDGIEFLRMVQEVYRTPEITVA